MPARMPGSVEEVSGLLLQSPGPVLALALLLVGSALQVYWGTTGPALGIAVVLVLLRSFLEWFFHRCIWHVRPARLGNPIAAAHRWHHEHPDDPEGVVFGWQGVLALYLLALSVCSPVTGIPPAVAVADGFMLLLLIYEWFHVLAHSNVAPGSPWLSQIIANHRRHHDGAWDACFGVSSTLADKVLGTWVSTTEKDDVE